MTIYRADRPYTKQGYVMRSIHDPQYVEFAARLRAAREHKGLSQAEVARRLGHPQSYVSKIETCERRIDFLETLALCKALGIGLDAVVPAELMHTLAVKGKGDDYRSTEKDHTAGA